MKRSIFIVLFLAFFNLFVFVVSAEEESKIQTPSGISYNEIGTKIENYITERKVGLASCSVAVFNDNDVFYEGYFGYSDMENKIVTDNTTVYEWGSVSKFLVWVSVMQLYEQGKLDLNRDISNYLPEDFLTKLKYDDKITILNLMNHNAGWQETSYNIEVGEIDKIMSLEKALKDSEPRQIYRPGEITAYSNWGSALAAYIVENVSGMDYSEYVKKNIFFPLGMEHTSVLADGSDNLWVQEQRRKLKCYNITQDSLESLGDCIRYIQVYPAGAAMGTMKDLITFTRAFLQDKQESVLFEKPGNSSGVIRNCHGLWTMEYAVMVKGHGGNTSGGTANVLFYDEDNLAVVVLVNEPGETAFCYGIPSLIFGECKENEREIINRQDIHGIYRSARTVKQGFLRLYEYIGNLFPISKTDTEGIYKLSIGDGTLTQLTEGKYIFDNGNEMKAVQYLYRNEKGETYLQQYTSDYKLSNPLVFWTNI